MSSEQVACPVHGTPKSGGPCWHCCDDEELAMSSEQGHSVCDGEFAGPAACDCGCPEEHGFTATEVQDAKRRAEEEAADPMVTVTMRRSAALQFHRALIRGSVVLEDHPRWADDSEWLLWGTGRLVTADPEIVDRTGG